MLNVSLFEGKTREEAVEKALDYYNLDEEYLLIKELESEDDSVKIEVIDKADIKFFIKEYLSKLSELLNIDINTEIREVEGSYNVKLVSSNNSKTPFICLN